MNRQLTGTALERSIVDVLNRYVTGTQSVTAPATAGDMTLTVEGTDRIQSGQQIEIYDSTHAETHTVDCVASWTTVTLDSPILSDFDNPQIQHLYDGLPVVRTYVGNPPVKPLYPLITVSLVRETEEPHTLETVRHDCEFEILIQCETAAYDDSYRLVRTLSRRAQNALTRPFTFLVEPYSVTTLAAPVNAGDDTFSVDDPTAIGGAALFLLPYAQYWIPVYDRNDSEYATVFRTDHVFTRSFDVGTKVITPLVHVFDTRLTDVSYEKEHTSGGLLHTAAISFSYALQLNQRRKYDTL